MPYPALWIVPLFVTVNGYNTVFRPTKLHYVKYGFGRNKNVPKIVSLTQSSAHEITSSVTLHAAAKPEFSAELDTTPKTEFSPTKLRYDGNSGNNNLREKSNDLYVTDIESSHNYYDSDINSLHDPSMIEFVGLDDPSVLENQIKTMTLAEAQAVAGSQYPFAVMMQGSAVYIAAHAGKVAVIHIPGELIESEEVADHILKDVALCWLLGMKIVIVVGTRRVADSCDLDAVESTFNSLLRSPECHNTLRVTDAQTLRFMEEETGFLRTEIERKLNRCLRAHGSGSSTADAPSLEGNVVGGNFYTAQQFGVVRGEDFQYTGFTSSVNKDGIQKVLNNNDVVLLSSVGLSPSGELVNVNSYHLAAVVASKLEASKVIYVANEGSAVLRKKGERNSIQELPLSFSKSILAYHQVKCHNTGFATFEKARQNLEPGSVELLLHLGWSNWALDKGVRRAHIVNPFDGALLEELYTRKNGANTCLYHDEDGVDNQEEIVTSEDWNEFFDSAMEPVQTSR